MREGNRRRGMEFVRISALALPVIASLASVLNAGSSTPDFDPPLSPGALVQAPGPGPSSPADGPRTPRISEDGPAVFEPTTIGTKAARGPRSPLWPETRRPRPGFRSRIERPPTSRS